MIKYRRVKKNNITVITNVLHLAHLLHALLHLVLKKINVKRNSRN
jgi:hypothetical protein